MAESILYIMEKLKSFLQNDKQFYGFIVLLVGFLSFFLGQQSVTSKQASTDLISVEPFAGRADAEKSVDYTSKTDQKSVYFENSSQPAGVVASKSGSKYHLPACPGAKQIKPDNLVRFDSVEKARAAGYTPAANCPGLE